MKKHIIHFSILSLLFVTFAFTITPGDRYEVTNGFSIKFKSADPSGNFEEMSGTIFYDKSNPLKSKLELKIKVASINTGNGMRDKKAMTEEWFDQRQYPEITFVSSAMTKLESGDYQIDGTLTMKGVSEKVSIPASLTDNGDKIVFKGSFKVDRLIYGVGKKSDVVPGIMKINFEVPASKK